MTNLGPWNISSSTGTGIKMGDIGLTAGEGVVAWLIRHWTGSSYAHALVFHRLLDIDPAGRELWETGESYPKLRRALSGPRRRTRWVDPNVPAADRRALKVVRVARNHAERQAVVNASKLRISKRNPYGWGSIVAVVLHLPKFGRGVICSEHVEEAICAARPEFAALVSDLAVTDPGRLSEALDTLEQADRDAPGARAA